MAKIIQTALPVVPRGANLEQLRTAAAGCQACDLWKTGTQSVFGEGEVRSVAVFVGEQPGDVEDRMGRPFVGPAGRLLDRALVSAGIDRSRVYVTNAVKHFKWQARGKRRIHSKPDAAEWIAKLGMLISDPALRARFAVAGRQTIENRYSLHVNAPRVAVVLRQAAESRSRKG